MSALIAQDIAAGRRPVFYYGVEYAGTFEPSILSLSFGLFGPSLTTYHGTLLVLLVGGSWLAADAVARLFGIRAGLVTALYLGLGPTFLLFKTLTSDGSYCSLFLLCALALNVFSRISAASRPLGLLPAFSLGAVLGVAWWVQPISVLLVGAVGVGVVLLLLERRLGASHVAVMLVGSSVGMSPWLVRNLETSFASLRMGELRPAHLGVAAERLGDLLAVSLPVLLGPEARASGSGTSLWAAAAASSLLIATLIQFGLALRRAQGVRGSRPFGAVVATLTLATLAAGPMVARASPEEPRFLLPIYLGLACMLGVAIDNSLCGSRPGGGAILAVLALSLVLSSHFRSRRLVGLQRGTSVDGGVGGLVTAPAPIVLAELAGRGISHFYGSYWTAYRLTFLSQKKIVGTPHGRVAVCRSAEIQKAVDDDRSPAFLVEGGDLVDLHRWLRARRVPFRSEKIEGLTLIQDIPAEELSLLRANHRTPIEAARGTLGPPDLGNRR